MSATCPSAFPASAAALSATARAESTVSRTALLAPRRAFPEAEPDEPLERERRPPAPRVTAAGRIPAPNSSTFPVAPVVPPPPTPPDPPDPPLNPAEPPPPWCEPPPPPAWRPWSKGNPYSVPAGLPEEGVAVSGERATAPGAPEAEAMKTLARAAAAIVHRRCFRGRDLTGREYSLPLGLAY